MSNKGFIGKERFEETFKKVIAEDQIYSIEELKNLKAIGTNSLTAELNRNSRKKF